MSDPDKTTPLRAPLRKPGEAGAWPSEDLGTKVSRLSPAEREVLDLLAKGYRAAKAADQLNLPLPTVHTRIRRILGVFNVHSQIEAVSLGGPISPFTGILKTLEIDQLNPLLSR